MCRALNLANTFNHSRGPPPASLPTQHGWPSAAGRKQLFLRKQIVLWVIAGAALFFLTFKYLARAEPQRSVRTFSDESASQEVLELPATEPRSENRIAWRPSTVAQSIPTVAAAAPTTASTIVPECSKDSDCSRPRHAECISFACFDGKCRYDDSGCDCRSPNDCEDGDPCTRNHCFVPTMKCIYIPIDGCK